MKKHTHDRVFTLAEKVLVVTICTSAETPAAVGGYVLYGWIIVNYGDHSTVAFI